MRCTQQGPKNRDQEFRSGLVSEAVNFKEIEVVLEPDSDLHVQIEFDEVIIGIEREDFPGGWAEVQQALSERGLRLDLLGEISGVSFQSIIAEMMQIDPRGFQNLLLQGRAHVFDKSRERYLDRYWSADYGDSESLGIVFIFPERDRAFLSFCPLRLLNIQQVGMRRRAG